MSKRVLAVLILGVCGKDSDYDQDLVTIFAAGLRDGPREPARK